MTIEISIDGIKTTADVSPFGSIGNHDMFVTANIVPIAHIALNVYEEQRIRVQSVPNSLRS